MREFAQAFLLVFAQLAVGGMATLVIPPFGQLERGFFKSTAAVYLVLGSLALAGWVALLPGRDVTLRAWIEIGIWGAFLASTATYLYSLYGEPYRLRSRSFAAALLLGALGLAVTSFRYLPESGGPVAIVLYPIAFLAEAFVLGTACSGMLLGHWYLVDTGLTLTPFRRMQRAFVGALHVEVLVGGLVVVAALLAGNEAFHCLISDHMSLLLLRIVLGPVAAYALGWMVARTLDLPQTMAATGLFYIALLAVVVGEILGRTIVFRTALPL